MPKFGDKSLSILRTCSPKINRVMRVAIVSGPDFSIISGFRPEDEQNKLFEIGRSEKKWPDSAHNVLPLSDAADIAPYPLLWGDPKKPETVDESIRLFNILGPYILGVGHTVGVQLIWGGDWDRDWDTTDQIFHDLGHFEEVR